jgi:hypothetical protein
VTLVGGEPCKLNEVTDVVVDEGGVVGDETEEASAGALATVAGPEQPANMNAQRTNPEAVRASNVISCCMVLGMAAHPI